MSHSNRVSVEKNFFPAGIQFRFGCNCSFKRELNILRRALKLGFICLFIRSYPVCRVKKPQTWIYLLIHRSNRRDQPKTWHSISRQNTTTKERQMSENKVVQHLSNDANRFEFLTWKIWRVKSEVTTKLRFWQLTDLGCPTPKKVAPMSYIISNHGSSILVISLFIFSSYSNIAMSRISLSSCSYFLEYNNFTSSHPNIRFWHLILI